MVKTIIALCFEVFTVNSMGDDNVMCFKSMNESNLRVTISTKNGIPNHSIKKASTSRLISFNVSLSEVSADLQNAIRTATRMSVTLDELIAKNKDVIARYEESGRKITALFIENRKLEGQIDMLSADLVTLESDIIIPGLRSRGIDITEHVDSSSDVEFSVRYTDDHGMSYKK